ncbi:MAG: hypothetical protein ACLFUK_10780, partial [Halanaerobium sp.]
NERLKSLNEKKLKAEGFINEDYTLKLLDEMWILCGFSKIFDEFQEKVSTFSKEKRKLGTTDKKFLGDPELEEAYYAVGCVKCNDSGYYGRLAIQEIFEIDNQLKEMISNHQSKEVISEYAKENGMITLKQDGITKIKAGETDVAELERIIY